MKTYTNRLITLTLVSMVALAACNFPGANPERGLLATSSAQTVEAQLTAYVATFSVTQPAVTLPPVATVTLPTNQPPLPTSTFIPTSTPVPIPCDRALFITDVTIPDGTLLSPNQSFTKTWRLQNNGSCTWNSSYALVFDSGQQMGGPNAVFLTGGAAPGQAIDISVNLTAPAAAGNYRGNWKLRNASGGIFGLTGNVPFYVDIKVSSTSSPTPTPTTPSSTTVYDFGANFCSAVWSSYPPFGGIPCPGENDDAEGFVVKIGNPQLETGVLAGKPALETHPRWVNDGLVQGKFPPVIIEAGSRFKTTLACLSGGGSCDVSYQLNYYADGSATLQTLGSWHEVYDGSVTNLDLDLSALTGKSVQFVMVVLSNGNSGQDWALWVDPKITK